MDSLFPFIDVMQEDVSETEDESPLKEYAWDFEKNEFIEENGRPVVVEDAEAIKIWIYKALSTPRYRFMAYSWDYGQEFEDLIGRQFGGDVIKSEAERYLQEALSVNPHIQNIQNVAVRYDGSKINIDFTVETDQGEVSISV